jgi:aryl-alcohol dehydrogenase-like predicted oxidoreductase
LAKGLLVGRYTNSQTFSATDDERFGFPQFQGEAFAKYVDAAQSLNAIAADVGLTLLQLALAWALRQPVVASVLVGAKTPNQIEDYLPAASVNLDDETLARIQAIVSPVPEIKSRTRVE